MRGTSRAVDQLTGAIEKVKRGEQGLCLFSIPEEMSTRAAATPQAARSTARCTA